MKSMRFLFILVVICCALTAFFRGCHPTPKHDVKETTVSNATALSNPFSVSSPAYRQLAEFRQWLLTNKNLEVASGSASPIDRIKLSGQLGAKGMARLPTFFLEQYMPVMGKILNSLDDAACSNFLRGKMSLTDFQPRAIPVIESFNEADAKAFFAVTKSAIDAQLDDLPIIVLPKEEAKQSILKIAASLPADKSKSFLAKLAHLKTESDADVCATVRILFSQGALLSEPYRGYVARLLLSGMDGHDST
ncbi:hypothetical protein PQR66_32660 [Paraburkholderia agricolaris]|uniref:Uncharacterized protein n=1 Tax=Paraburkholderia agricolaris TaxID=2152888 RepID=A0ABW8ZYL2_9BURK